MLLCKLGGNKHNQTNKQTNKQEQDVTSNQWKLRIGSLKIKAARKYAVVQLTDTSRAETMIFLFSFFLLFLALTHYVMMLNVDY